QTSEKSSSSQGPQDAQKYQELDVVLFSRGSCPYCVQAVDLLRKRGVSDLNLQDVGWSQEAAKDMRSKGGDGVPFFYSRRTGKSAAGWNPGATDLEWLVRRLS
ncbi:unnamed protein product, partial [Polarella glacialis]